MNKEAIIFNCIAILAWVTNLCVFIEKGKEVPLYAYAAVVCVILLFHIGLIVTAALKK